MTVQAGGVKVTLSIVNTNNRELLRKCVDTIFDTVRETTYEIIVVENASTDGSFEMLTSKYPSVRVIRNTEKQGYGKCHNHAIRASKGDCILILNEDMEMLEGAVDRMVAKAESIDNLGVLGCRIVNPDHTLQHSCFTFPTLGGELFEALFPQTVVFGESTARSKMYYWQHDTERQVDIVVGCCMLLPRRAVEVVGMFDPAFFVYSEEHDLCRRMRDAGLKVVFTPESEMIHIGGQTSKRMSLKMALVQLESRMKYFRKHEGPVAAAVFRVILAVAAAVRLVGWGAVYPFARDRRNTVTARLQEYSASLKFVMNVKS